MWFVERIEAVPRELNFESAGMKRHATTALLADGECLVNALDLIDLTRTPVQLIVCEACGTPVCASGNYVVIRRLQDGIAIVPDFMSMTRSGTEHQPPEIMRHRGVPFFAGAVLDHLRTLMPAIAPLDRWPPLSVREAAWLVQWNAPAGVLGAFPRRPVLDRESLLAIEDDDPDACADALDRLLVDASGRDEALTIVDGAPVTFFFDLRTFTEWRPLVRKGHEVHLSLGPRLAFT